MSRDVVPLVRPEDREDLIRSTQGRFENFRFTGSFGVGEGRFEQVSDAVEFMRILQVVPAPFGYMAENLLISQTDARKISGFFLAEYPVVDTAVHIGLHVGVLVVFQVFACGFEHLDRFECGDGFDLDGVTALRFPESSVSPVVRIEMERDPVETFVKGGLDTGLPEGVGEGYVCSRNWG